jgi:hypothetical protein
LRHQIDRLLQRQLAEIETGNICAHFFHLLFQTTDFSLILPLSPIYQAEA